MKKRAAIGMVSVSILFAAAALVPALSHQLRLAILPLSELSLKLPPPPDDSCFQIQRALTGAISDKAVRESGVLGADEISIYEAVLKRWNSKSSKPLNLSNRTTPLDRDISDCECLKGMDVQSLAKAARSFRLLTRDALPSGTIRLVDAELQNTIVRDNDPHNLMGKGVSVHAAVDKAFANGLFELSEIAFDKAHRRAIVSYSFVCGSLCGNGGVWLFEKVDGVWRKPENVCGGWIS